VVTYRLNASKAKREFKREKLEALFQALHSYCKTIRVATTSWPLVITGKASRELALETQTKHYLDPPDDIDRCTLLVALYFRELESNLERIKEAATELNTFTEKLGEESPSVAQKYLDGFHLKLDLLAEEETTMKLRIAEIARRCR